MLRAQATLEEVTEADLLLHVLDASSPQVLQQRAAVLGVLRGLGVPEARLREGVIEVWNKMDQLPGQLAAGPVAGKQQLGERQVGWEPGEAPAAAIGSPPPITLGSSGSSGGVGAAEAALPDNGGAAAPAACQLPPAVEALLASDAAAAGYRPTAVATSVLQNEGLSEVLAAVESKVRAVCGSRPARATLCPLAGIALAAT